MRMRNRIFGVIALSVACIGLGADTSRATIMISLGNNPQPNEVNIHLNGGETGTTVTGTAETTLGTYFVDFSSTQTLEVASQGNGQAFIQAIDGSDKAIGLTNGTISLGDDSPTSTFEDFILNLSNGGKFTATGVTLTIDSVDENGMAETPTIKEFDSLGQGQNFYTIIASGGEQIKSISFATTGGALDGFDSLRQPRISFSNANAVPEPSTLISGAMAALCLLGFGLHRRRRSA